MLKNNEQLKILVVEDDVSLGYLLTENLLSKNIEVRLAQTGRAGIEALQSEHFDLCILDIMLPETDGFAVAAMLNKYKPNTPFIFLTALNQDNDKYRGFETGADDFITKPFNFKELYYRILAVLRRKNVNLRSASNLSIEIGPLVFNPILRELKLNGTRKKISHREASLLYLLLQSYGDYVNRYEILKKVWGVDNSLAARSMEVYITRLRKLLKEDPAFEIENLYGEGYRLFYKH